MDYTKQCLRFVCFTTGLLFLLSIADYLFHWNWKVLHNINIVSDIVRKEKVTVYKPLASDSIKVYADTASHKSFSLFEQPNQITEYFSDSLAVALKKFIVKLETLKQGKRKKLRVAFMGDSMIEEDNITSTLRKLLQKEFGGYGIGFLPMSTALSNERPTAGINASVNWEETNFMNNKVKANLFLSGRNFKSIGDASTQITDKTTEAGKLLYKYFLIGKNADPVSVSVNGDQHIVKSQKSFQSFLLDSSAGNKIRFEVSVASNIYGVSLESANGLILDNFSFRGVSGQEFGNVDSAFLASISKEHPYDLIVLQYGVNLFEKPTDDNFNWYYKPFERAIKKIQSCFPDASILLVGTADRAYRYEQDYETAIGIPGLIALQQKLAYATGIGFYNTFSSMGGNGSIVKWVDANPPLAYKDYMHPNPAGAAVIGKSIFEAIMHEYRKYKTYHP
jgi:lysophospholipase L1-like esterase